MHLLKISASGYSNRAVNNEVLAAYGRERWDALRLKLLDIKIPTWDEIIAESSWWSIDGLATMDEVIALTEAGLKLELHRVRGLFDEVGPREALMNAQRGATTTVQIHVPGSVSLTSINEVTWLEDCCTQELQSHLDEGYRIIAVCPPNDSRRPTYIIGRTK